MTGHIVPGAGNRFLVRLSRERLLGLPLLRAEVPGKSLTPRRVRRTARALRKAGVVRVLAPEEFPLWNEVLAQGLRPVETGELCRALAVPVTLAALAGDGVPLRQASVTLRGDRALFRGMPPPCRCSPPCGSPAGWSGAILRFPPIFTLDRLEESTYNTE